MTPPTRDVAPAKPERRAYPGLQNVDNADKADTSDNTGAARR